MMGTTVMTKRRLRAGRQRKKRTPDQARAHLAAETWQSLKASLEATLEPARGKVLTPELRRDIAAACAGVFKALRLTRAEALEMMRVCRYDLQRAMEFKDEPRIEGNERTQAHGGINQPPHPPATDAQESGRDGG